MNTNSKIIWGAEPELFGPKDWFRNSLIIKAVKQFSTGNNILDYGCGSGILMQRLDKLNFFTTGVDPSKLNIDHIKKKIFNKKPKLIVGTHKELNNSTTFDVITCGEVLEHIKDDESVIKKFSTVLKQGGICIISVPAHQSKFSNIDSFAGHYRRYELDQLKNKFVKHKFKVISAYYWGFPIGNLWDYLITGSIFKHKIKQKKINTEKKTFMSTFLMLGKHQAVKRILEYIFYFDMIFNWTKLGNGIIFIAKKS